MTDRDYICLRVDPSHESYRKHLLGTWLGHTTTTNAVQSILSDAGIEYTHVIGLKKHSVSLQESWLRIKKEDEHLLNIINDGVFEIIPDWALDNIGFK